MPPETHAGVRRRAQLRCRACRARHPNTRTSRRAPPRSAVAGALIVGAVLAPLASLRGVQRNRKAAEDEVARRSRARAAQPARARAPVSPSPGSQHEADLWREIDRTRRATRPRARAQRRAPPRQLRKHVTQERELRRGAQPTTGRARGERGTRARSEARPPAMTRRVARHATTSRRIACSRAASAPTAKARAPRARARAREDDKRPRRRGRWWTDSEARVASALEDGDPHVTCARSRRGSLALEEEIRSRTRSGRRLAQRMCEQAHAARRAGASAGARSLDLQHDGTARRRLRRRARRARRSQDAKLSAAGDEEDAAVWDGGAVDAAWRRRPAARRRRVRRGRRRLPFAPAAPARDHGRQAAAAMWREPGSPSGSEASATSPLQPPRSRRARRPSSRSRRRASAARARPPRRLWTRGANESPAVPTSPWPASGGRRPQQPGTKGVGQEGAAVHQRRSSSRADGDEDLLFRFSRPP